VEETNGCLLMLRRISKTTESQGRGNTIGYSPSLLYHR
jgi:hypothetical protein